MILKMYSMRDSKAEVFNRPFFATAHGEAERQFQRIVNDDKSVIFEFPEDFDLYYIGEYDDNTGKIAALDTPQHMMKAVSVKRHVSGSRPVSSEEIVRQ